MDKKKVKDMVMIQGTNVAPLTEKELKEFHEQMSDKLKELKDNEFMDRLETELIRKALQSAEEKLAGIEEENSILREDLVARKEEDGRLTDIKIDKKDASLRQLKLPRVSDAEQSALEQSEETIHRHKKSAEMQKEKELESSKEALEYQYEDEVDEVDEEEEEAEIDKEEDLTEKESLFPESKIIEGPLSRRDRLKEMGIDLKSLKIITDPDDPQFYKSVKEENVDDVAELKQEIKLFQYEYLTGCDEIEKVFKSRLMHFNQLWTDEVKSKLQRKIQKAEAKKNLTYEMIEDHLKWTHNKRESDRKKLKVKLTNLDQARTKMIEDRYRRKEEYMKDKFYMEKMMVAESYDTVIKQLKENHNVVYVDTQQFFRDTAENDILLIISLKNELKTLQANMDKMDEEIGRMKAGIKEIKGPLEESEKETRWMETFVAAISKDTKSMACHKKYNEELQKTIDSIHEECVALDEDIKTKKQNYLATNRLKENVTEWGDKYKNSNTFIELMKDAFQVDVKKMQKTEKLLVSKGLILPKHIPLIRSLVHKKVNAAKKIQFARQKEVKAFNELINQLQIRSAGLLVDSWPKVQRMGGVPYRKTPANLLATYNLTKKYGKSDSLAFGDFVTVQKVG